MKITWIRHGQTEENVKGTYYGALETQLTEEGKKSLQDVKVFLEQEGMPKRIYSSPQMRALESVECLTNQEVQQDARLCERHMGLWEGLKYEEIKQNDPKACKAWEADWKGYVLPEGESAYEHYEKVKSFVKMLEEKNEDALVVAHSGTLRMALAYMFHENIDCFWKFKVEPGARVSTLYEEGFWYMTQLENPIPHKVKVGSKKNETILVTGGCRSGKSIFAEELLAPYEDVLYIATAKVTDEEMQRRVQKHKQRRSKAWRTHEGYKDLASVIKTDTSTHFLLDCVTILTSNFMFEDDLPFEDKSPEQQEDTLQCILKEVETLIQAAKAYNKQLIIVTNEVGEGIVPSYALGRVYRDYIGLINQKIAKEVDHVYEVKCGISILLK